MTTILGIAGKKRVGKDTFLNYLETSTDYSVSSYAFARPIYTMIEALLGIDLPRDFDGEVDKNAIISRYGVTLRHMLQTLGTEWGREHINRDIWIIEAERWLNNAITWNPTYIVFTDVRFPNEAKFIRKRGGVIVNIHRECMEVSNHPSEDGLPIALIDHTISNNGSLDDYYMAIARVLRDIHGE